MSDIERKKGSMKQYVWMHLLFSIYSISGVCSKLASTKEVLSFDWILLYGLLLIILFVYAFFWKKILKYFSLITAYASKSMTVVWGIIWGKIFFKEEISIGTIIGTGIIIIGIFLIATEEEK